MAASTEIGAADHKVGLDAVSRSAASGETSLGQGAPDFFIVGHHKCGTTALYEMLRRHPQIYMPERKEPKFFASDVRQRDARAATGDPETLEEYLSLFAPASPEQRVGEASPQYLWSRAAPGQIAALRPDARIIAILREPASFLRSLHLHWLLHHVETEKDFRRAISLERERRRGRHIPRSSRWPQALLYSDHVRYVEQLRRYHACFPPEQVLVLIYDDFRADNEATVRRVLRFLDVDDTAPIQALETNRTKVQVRAVRLDGLIRALYVGRGPVAGTVNRAVKTLVPKRLRRDAFRAMRRRLVWGRPQPPDERFLLELRERFKGEVVALSEYLGRDLVALWGYDRVGP
ncbi:MAG TPA: sulfotransferase [Solirubrobacteraceae bacterium]|jgi:hypothetical protein|nr:sulfotransferase [Solirubrobacteraceae bacterium]